MPKKDNSVQDTQSKHFSLNRFLINALTIPPETKPALHVVLKAESIQGRAAPLKTPQIKISGVEGTGKNKLMDL